MQIPQTADLAFVYDQIFSKKNISEDNLIRYLQMARFDPRLMEILIDYGFSNWQKWNPIKLKQNEYKMHQPALLGIYFELLSALIQDEGFTILAKMIQANIKKAPGEIFYFGIHPFDPVMARLLVHESHSVFQRWGFYEPDLPISKSKQKKFNFSKAKKADRMKILDQLILQKKYIQMGHYEEILGKNNFSVSRRTLELDLCGHPKLQSRGKTKGRIYRVLGYKD